MVEKTCKCLCGAVSFVAEIETTDFGVCHCKMCQRWSSGPSLTADAAINNLTGENDITFYQSSEWAQRAFCSKCGSNLWYEIIAEGPNFGAKYMSAGVIDDLGGMKLATEIFIEEKPDAYCFSGDLLQMTGEEVFAAHSSTENGN